jgi:CspA family cold shock protein
VGPKNGSTRKGYGVIKPVDGGFNVYVNNKAVERAGLAELKEGQKVHFDIVSDNRTSKAFAEDLSVPLNRQEDAILADPQLIKTTPSRTRLHVNGYASGCGTAEGQTLDSD